MKSTFKAFILMGLLLVAGLAFDDASKLASLRADIHFAGNANMTGASKLSLETYRLPQNDERQSAICDVNVSAGDMNNGRANFQWESSGSIGYDYKCTVRVKPVGNRILKKVSFPYGEIPQEYKNFMAPSDIVVVDGEIPRLAETLAGTSTDAFEIVSRISDWVNRNVEYDLPYKDIDLYAKKSNDTLKSRKGVCSEYAHLFLALVRGLGIPARYVGGQTYGTLGDKAEFEAHAWTEVYFPEYGWVPFDPTYGQNGHVDATHIKFYTSVDGTFAADRTQFSYAGEKPAVKWTHEDAEVKITDEQPGFGLVNLTGSFTEKANGGEFVLLHVTARNTADTAISPMAKLMYTDEKSEKNLQLAFGKNETEILLYPNEKKELLWALEAPVPGERLMYTFPVLVTVGSEAIKGKTTVYPNKASALMTVAPDKEKYAAGEKANLTIMIKSDSYDGEFNITELTSGTSTRSDISMGAEKTVYMQVPASAAMAVYSTTNNFVLLKGGVGDNETFSAELEMPPSAVYMRPFKAAVHVNSSKEEFNAIVDFDGQRATKKVQKAATFYFSTMSEASKEYEVKVYTDMGVKLLKKSVTILDAPKIAISMPDEIFKESTKIIEDVEVSYGRLVSLRVVGGDVDQNTYEFRPNSCGPQKMAITVKYVDLLETPGEETLEKTVNVNCDILPYINSKLNPTIILGAAGAVAVVILAAAILHKKREE